MVIPAPSLAEFLVHTGEATAGILDIIDRRSAILVAPFDRRCAVTCALIDRAAINSGNKNGARKLEAWQKIKIDRQILAICNVHNVERIVSNDTGVRAEAKQLGVTVSLIEELPTPPEALQRDLGEEWDSW